MTTNGISGFFEKDHDEIDQILATVDCARPGEALPRFEEFDRRLERHIVWEESLLFPSAVDAAPHLEQGPVGMMKMEHVRIRASKAEAVRCLRGGDAAGARRAIEEMLEALGPHNMKEERILYPLCDQLLAGPAAEALLARVHADASR